MIKSYEVINNQSVMINKYRIHKNKSTSLNHKKIDLSLWNRIFRSLQFKNKQRTPKEKKSNEREKTG